MPQLVMRLSPSWMACLVTTKFAWDPKNEELTGILHYPKRHILLQGYVLLELKNAGAIYQRAMHKIFNDMFHKMLSVMSMT